MRIATLTGLVMACSPVGLINLAISREGYRIEKDVPYGADPRQKMDLYVPDGASGKTPVIVFFYGGSWDTGTKALYLAFGQAFASKGIMVAIPDYRLYPQVVWPTFLDDSARAFAFVHNHAAQYGGDTGRIFLAGHSAGAYNAMMLAADPKYLKDAGGDASWIHGVIGIAGPYDFLPLQDPKLVAIFGGANRPETQPINHIDGKRPPMLLAHGTADTTVLPRNTLNLEKKLAGFQSPVTVKLYPDVAHIGIILSLAPGFRGKTTLRQDMLDFVAAH